MGRAVEVAGGSDGVGGVVRSSGAGGVVRSGGPTPSDAAVLGLVASGMVEEVGVLAARYERLMLGVARGLVGGDTGAAMDCVQDAWVRVIRGAGTFAGTGSAKAWLLAVVVNAARDRGRKLSRRARHERGFALAGGGAEVDGAGGVGAPGEGVGDAGLRSALGTLRDGDREIVLLCACRSLTHEEAASALGLPLGTLKSRLYRSLRRLRVELEGAGGGDGSDGVKREGA